MCLRRMSLFVGLILFVCFLSAASESEKTPRETRPLSQTEQETESDKHKHATENKIPSTESVREKTAEPIKQTKGQETPGHWYDFLWQSSLPNWLVMIGWGLAFIVAWRTLGSLNEQVRANNLSAEAANESARAANRQIDVAVRNERPWIMVEGDWPTNPPAGIPGWSAIKWSAVNVGKSPAFLTKLSVEVKIVPLAIPDERPHYLEAESFAKFIIPPNGRHSADIPFVIDATQGSVLYESSHCIIFYGQIDYFDTLNGHIKTGH